MTQRKPLDFGEVNTMNCEQFDQWWDGKDPDSTANPYRKDTPAFWAWAGWKAGVLAEREACAQVCDAWGNRADAATIRARSTNDD